MNKFYIRIILPTILTILLFILVIFFIIIPRFQQNIMNGKREMIKELTNSAWSILSKYENDERNGLLTREEAQKTAVSRIQYLRYGEEAKDYFWITDMHPTMVMHPYRSDLNGKDLNSFSDPHGKKLFVEFVNIVKKSNHGYLDYMWQWKDDSTHIVPKLSYVRLFKPWGWVIGTGIYIEDVKKEIKALTNRLLWISIIISIIISALLFFISQQSLQIEQKRRLAENELNESKEKYRTLVEAATEGLIMLIDGKISFANHVIGKMTGYDSADLINLSIHEIFSDNNNKEVTEAFSGKIVQEGKYEINLKKKNGGYIEVLVTSSTGMLYSKAVNIIIIKDITIDRNASLSGFDYQKLAGTMNIGFFRAKIDSRGKFLFADETTIKLLGYNNFRELSEINILDMLADSEDRKTLRDVLLGNGYLKRKNIRIRRKNGESGVLTVSLITFSSENPADLICDGIIEDITTQEKERTETSNLIVQLKSGSFILEQPVSSFLSPVNTLNADATIGDVNKLLLSRKTDNVLLTSNEKDFMGIVTNSDIQKRVLALNLSMDNPAYLIMSAPVIYIRESTPVGNAILLSEERNANHLVVKNDSDKITGIFKTYDIYRNIKNSLAFYIESVKAAETTDVLKQCYQSLQSFIKPLVHNDTSTKNITQITSSFSDAVIKRVVDLTIKDVGEPPVDFSFICLGSEGRQEETLYTDQDNAIIYEKVPAEKEKLVNAYFNTLGEKICNALNQIGYSFCKGNIMAKNPFWCKPVNVWESYFASWINTPDPQSLLDATIFFDFRHIYGNDTLTDRLRNTISILIKERPLFLYHLAFNMYNTKVPAISSGSIISDKSADMIDLKNAVNLIIMFARSYAFQHSIWCTNTLDRLNALKAKQVISDTTAEEIIYAYNFLMKLRFRNQAAMLDNNLPLSNSLNTKKLIDLELSILKKALSLLSTYQNKISTDFRIAT